MTCCRYASRASRLSATIFWTWWNLRGLEVVEGQVLELPLDLTRYRVGAPAARRSPSSPWPSRLRRSGGRAESVRMLCSRSASLMRMTRMSLAIAMSILRRFWLCCSASDSNLILPSLVTPSTRSATSSPKRSRISERSTPAVLDDVVKQRRLQRRRVQMQLGEDETHLDGVLRRTARPTCAAGPRARRRRTRRPRPGPSRSASGLYSLTCASICWMVATIRGLALRLRHAVMEG